VRVMEGISPLALSSSSHSIKVKVPPHAVALYSAMPPSVTTPVFESMINCPFAGTTAVNQTSPPL